MKHLKTKLLVTFGFIFMGLLFFLSCETENDTETTNIETELSTHLKTIELNDDLLIVSQSFKNHTFQFNTVSDKNIISSTLLVQNREGKIIYKTAFSLDTSIKDYKLYQVEKIVDIANNLNYSLELNDYLILSEQFKQFKNNLYAQYKNQQIRPLLSSLFFHYSILNTKKRSIEDGKNDCDCTLHPGYLLEKTEFFCQEDYFMNTNVIKDAINKNKDAFLDASSLSLKKYLNTTTKEFIPFDKLYSFYIDKDLYLKTLDLIKNKDNTVDKLAIAGDCAWWCPLGCGSAWGCCGNYSGCCLYSNPLCLIHDAICTNCEPAGFCLDGCIPD